MVSCSRIWASERKGLRPARVLPETIWMGLSQLVAIPCPLATFRAIWAWSMAALAFRPLKLKKYCTPVIASSRMRMIINGVRDAVVGAFMKVEYLVICVEGCGG